MAKDARGNKGLTAKITLMFAKLTHSSGCDHVT